MGVIYKGQRIDMNEHDGIFSNLPVEELVEYLKSKNVPSEISLTAGSYICNMTMFLILREAKRIGTKGGFIHIPCHERCAIESKRDMPFMSLDKIKEAVNLAIEFYLKS
ncbi:pyrrolidone-carboxylate peptidase [Sulfolobus acidocaldarius SUSAZ]|nr:pyrrolidone-carboxylate peptidase [Sulfolobus acidocaldarius SUSAZ]